MTCEWDLSCEISRLFFKCYDFLHVLCRKWPVFFKVSLRYFFLSKKNVSNHSKTMLLILNTWHWIEDQTSKNFEPLAVMKQIKYLEKIKIQSRALSYFRIFFHFNFFSLKSLKFSVKFICDFTNAIWEQFFLSRSKLKKRKKTKNPKIN